MKNISGQGNLTQWLKQSFPMEIYCRIYFVKSFLNTIFCESFTFMIIPVVGSGNQQKKILMSYG